MHVITKSEETTVGGISMTSFTRSAGINQKVACCLSFGLPARNRLTATMGGRKPSSALLLLLTASESFCIHEPVKSSTQ